MDAKLKERIADYEMMAFIVKEFMAELGKVRALNIIKQALEKLGQEHGRKRAEQLGGNSLDDLKKFYRKRAAQADNVELVEETDRHVAIKINRCLGAEAMIHLGLAEVAKIYCNTDYGMIKAFNPQMKMIRTKTIADGDAFCDHIWALED